MPVTDYVVQASVDGVTWGTVGDGASTATTARVPGPWATATADTRWMASTPGKAV